jgi:hypothetical protein
MSSPSLALPGVARPVRAGRSRDRDPAGGPLAGFSGPTPEAAAVHDGFARIAARADARLSLPAVSLGNGWGWVSYFSLFLATAMTWLVIALFLTFYVHDMMRPGHSSSASDVAATSPGPGRRSG